jgi:hypothetical protein
MTNRHIRFASIALAAAVLLPSAAAAQTAPAPPRPDQVESDPIRCWWKTDRTAVRVGERFTIVLTCGVIETGPITVVPAANQLEAGAIQLTPFEVVSGLRRDDIVSAPWRYLQFEYVVRLMNDGFFGQDVNVPALTVTYNLQAAGGSTQGREQSYVLPALPMRILSVVPRSAADIRDASDESFGAIESRRFRGTAATVAAFIAFAFAAALAVMAIVRATGRYRARDTARVKPVPAPSMLGGCLRALTDVREEAARGGWTPDLMRRALAALRVAGAVALDREVSQAYVARDASPREGQLAIRTGFLRRKRAVVSAPTTSKMIAAHLNGRAAGNGSANGIGRRPGTRARASLQALDEALRVFSAATYGRNGKPDGDALTTALDDGARAVKRLRVGTMWPVRAAEAVTRSFAGF